MKKDIKDYLHLYLGCHVCFRGQEKKGKINLENMWQLVGVHQMTYKKIVNIEAMDCFKALDPEDVFPILRPLSDMTEEEAKEIAGIMGINASVDDELKVKRVKNEIMVWNATDYGDDWDEADNNDAGVLIDLKTHLFSNNINEGDYHRVPDFITHANMFRYMLSKSFDLFGLIKSGLAIDKTKMNRLDADKWSVATEE